MERLGQIQESILLLVEKSPDAYHQQDIADIVQCDIATVQRMTREKYIRYPSNTGLFSLDLRGSSYLATLRYEENEIAELKDDARKTRRIAVWAIVISAIIGAGTIIAQLLPLLSRNIQ